MATGISRKAWNKYLNALRKINQKAAAEMEGFYNGLIRAGLNETNPEAFRKIVQRRAEEIVAYYGQASGAAAAQMYDASMKLAKSRTALPSEIAPVEPVARGVGYNVGRTIENGYSPKMIFSQVTKGTHQSAANTLYQNAKRDGKEFAWVPVGETCAYCIELASYGWRPAREDTEEGDDHQVHANCDCQFSVRDQRTGGGGVAGYNPEKYEKIFANADGETSQEKINSIRREQYAENKDVIRAQQREAYAERVEREDTSDK